MRSDQKASTAVCGGRPRAIYSALETAAPPPDGQSLGCSRPCGDCRIATTSEASALIQINEISAVPTRRLGPAGQHQHHPVREARLAALPRMEAPVFQHQTAAHISPKSRPVPDSMKLATRYCGTAIDDIVHHTDMGPDRASFRLCSGKNRDGTTGNRHRQVSQNWLAAGNTTTDPAAVFTS